MINGRPHGPQKATTVCQLHMRAFNNEDNILLEPFRAKSFPVIKDLSVDRKSFDRIISSGGYVAVDTGDVLEANSIPVAKEDADEAFLSSACIGCGACVAACKNSSAMLFTSAKVSHLGEGVFVSDVKEGEWTEGPDIDFGSRFFGNGTYSNNQKNGVWNYVAPRQNPTIKGSFASGKPSGEWVVVYNKKTYKGSFEEVLKQVPKLGEFSF